MANSPTTILRPRGLHVERTGANRARVANAGSKHRDSEISFGCHRDSEPLCGSARKHLYLGGIEDGTHENLRCLRAPLHDDHEYCITLSSILPKRNETMSSA